MLSFPKTEKVAPAGILKIPESVNINFASSAMLPPPCKFNVTLFKVRSISPIVANPKQLISTSSVQSFPVAISRLLLILIVPVPEIVEVGINDKELIVVEISRMTEAFWMITSSAVVGTIPQDQLAALFQFELEEPIQLQTSAEEEKWQIRQRSKSWIFINVLFIVLMQSKVKVLPKFN